MKSYEAIILTICVVILGIVSWSVFEDSLQKQQLNTEMTNRGCTKHHRVGQGKSKPYQYAVWKCPNDTNEYLVR